MLLALILPQLTTHAQEIQHVVVVVGDRMPNGLSRPKQLVAITQNSSTNIADVSHAKFFGEDGSTLAFLTAALSEKTNEPAWHLLIIDSLKSTIIANSLITSDSSFTQEMMMTPLSRLLVVDSNISEVCFPTFDFQHLDSFGFVNANWKTGTAQTHQNPYDILKLSDDFVPIPMGFAISFLDKTKQTSKLTAALFNITTQGMRLVPLPDVYGKSFGFRQIIFLPTVGLIEYSQESVSYSTNAVPTTNLVNTTETPVTVVRRNVVEHVQPAFFRLTDVALSTNLVSSAAIPTSNVNSEIVVRPVDGKPCLIWGENSDPKSRFGVISDIVIFDWNSKRELLRKSLETSTSSFQPNADGSKIYFIDLKDGKINCLDVKSQTIARFSDEPVPNPASSTIVAAY